MQPSPVLVALLTKAREVIAGLPKANNDPTKPQLLFATTFADFQAPQNA